MNLKELLPAAICNSQLVYHTPFSTDAHARYRCPHTLWTGLATRRQERYGENKACKPLQLLLFNNLLQLYTSSQMKQLLPLRLHLIHFKKFVRFQQMPASNNSFVSNRCPHQTKGTTQQDESRWHQTEEETQRSRSRKR